MNQTIKGGDTIAFTNADTDAHEVLFKATSGFTCTATPVVIQPAKTQSCTWTVAGSFSYSDPNQRDRNFRGTVKVNAVVPVVAPTVSLAASAANDTYGTQVTLSGKVAPNTNSTMVDIMAQASGETVYTKVTSVPTNGSGSYTFGVTPDIATNYRAEFANGADRVMSPVSAVSVRPSVSLVLRSRSGSRAYFAVRVTSGETYEGMYVRVQRKNQFGGWTTLKRATLGTFSTARFAVRLPSGTSRIRTLLPSSQAGVGYLAGVSGIVTVAR
jgi:hypothetical protein